MFPVHLIKAGSRRLRASRAVYRTLSLFNCERLGHSPDALAFVHGFIFQWEQPGRVKMITERQFKSFLSKHSGIHNKGTLKALVDTLLGYRILVEEHGFKTPADLDRFLHKEKERAKQQLSGLQ